MSNKVDITLAAQSEAVERALETMQKQLDAATLKLEKMSQKGKKGANDTGQSFKTMGDKIADMAMKGAVGFGSMTTAATVFHAAFRAIVKEAEEVRRRQKESLDTNVSVGSAVRQTRDAFSADATLGEKDLEPAIAGISKRTRASPTAIANSLATGFSAKGKMSNAAVVAATEQAYRLNPSNESQATVLLGRALDVAKASGTTDARANLGFLQNVQQAARVTTTEKVGQNLLPSIVSMTKHGDSLEGAAELATTLTQLMGDEEGQVSATALQQLGEQLHSFVPKIAEKGEHAGKLVGKDDFGDFVIPNRQWDEFQTKATTEDLIGVMERSPELRRAFESQASFETKAKQSVFSILRGDKTAKDAWDASRETIRGNNSADEQRFQSELFEAELLTKKRGAVDPIVTAQETFSASRERAQLEDVEGARAASAREIFKQAITDVDLPGIDQFNFAAGGWLGEWGEVGKRRSLEKSLYARERNLKKGGHGRNQTFEDPAILTLEGLVQKNEKRKFGDKYRTFERGSAEEKRILEAIESLKAQKQGFQENAAASSNQRDPQMEENNQLLRRIADKLEQQGTTGVSGERPKTRTPNTASLSRGS